MSTCEAFSDNNGNNNSNGNNKISNASLQNTGCQITHWNSTPLLLISGILLFSAIIVVLKTNFN
jgi:hypothetical protein